VVLLVPDAALAVGKELGDCQGVVLPVVVELAVAGAGVPIPVAVVPVGWERGWCYSSLWSLWCWVVVCCRVRVVILCLVGGQVVGWGNRRYLWQQWSIAGRREEEVIYGILG